MIVRCLRSIAEVEPFRGRINDLNLATERPDPFSTFEYIAVRVQSDPEFHASSSLLFLAAFAEDVLLGYAALKLNRRRILGWRSNRVEFLVGHDGDRPHFVAHALHIAAVTEGFLAYLMGSREWDLIEFQQQAPDSSLWPPPLQVSESHHYVTHWPNLSNYAVEVRWRSLAEYFNALSNRFRGNIRRGMCRLYAAGQLQLLSSTNPSATPALFELYRGIEKWSWKSTVGVSVAGNVARTDCMRRVLEPGQPMQIAIQILLLDGVPIAGLISGSFQSPNHKNSYLLHVVFDDRYSAGAPGSAILLFGVHSAIIGGHTSINLLSGFGHYKSRWLAQCTPTRCAQIYRVNSLPYWRRRIGNIARAWSLRSESTADATRREQLSAHGGTESSVVSTAVAAGIAPCVTDAERNWSAALIEQALQGKGELMSSADLARILPFDVTMPRTETRVATRSPPLAAYQ